MSVPFPKHGPKYGLSSTSTSGLCAFFDCASLRQELFDSRKAGVSFVYSFNSSPSVSFCDFSYYTFLIPSCSVVLALSNTVKQLQYILFCLHPCNMFGSSAGSGLLRFVVVGLYSLLLSSLAETILVLYLYAIRSVDTTMSASLILSFVGVSF